ncbi:MAG: hypothetical protein RR614_03035 [Eubacterium sp.]
MRGKILVKGIILLGITLLYIMAYSYLQEAKQGMISQIVINNKFIVNYYSIAVYIVMPLLGILFGILVGVCTGEKYKYELKVSYLVMALLFIVLYFYIVLPFSGISFFVTLKNTLYASHLSYFLFPILSGFYLIKGIILCH